MGMLGQALALALLLLLHGHHGQERLESSERVSALPGASLQLRPPRVQTEVHSVEWKVQLPSELGYSMIVCSKNETVEWTGNDTHKRFRFVTEDLTLLINAVQHNDSGLYLLEVTNESGIVWRHQFQVSVFDPVGKPHLLEQWEALDGGACQVTLSCSVSSGGDVNYTWYRGTELIQTPRNLTQLEEQIDAKGSHTYTCNVSNPVSWANHTVRLTPGCLSLQKFGFLPWVIITFLIIALSLGTLTCFCVRRRKRKPSQSNPEEILTIYEEVNNLPIRRNQEQKQQQQQSPPGEGSTIYARIQSQSSASTSQKPGNTLYSLVQPSQKCGSKKRNHSPASASTIYEEVGKRYPKAQNPARLSRKELENFCAYS